MKTLPLLGCLILAGCASKQEHFTPVSSVAVTRSLTSATEKAVALKKFVAPEGRKIADDLSNDLFNTQVELGKYVGKVDELYRQLDKAQEEATYWHEKQLKALKELLFWRGLAIMVVLGVAAYIGLKTSWRFLL